MSTQTEDFLYILSQYFFQKSLYDLLTLYIGYNIIYLNFKLRISVINLLHLSMMYKY